MLFMHSEKKVLSHSLPSDASWFVNALKVKNATLISTVGIIKEFEASAEEYSSRM